ncbi:hypothetical protein H5410_064463 [Solanum commersonii]|uniref:Uncharacterized protein n=1 Tax=Solanum commersonii TaxID=4109 RepID=A0A9J5VZB7_SOLCO|nr:hypothetical protein H5410_064463 [Solanum commersonii]
MAQKPDGKQCRIWRYAHGRELLSGEEAMMVSGNKNRLTRASHANALSIPPGSTFARMKLKGIDGASYMRGACGLIRCKLKNLTRLDAANPLEREGCLREGDTGGAWSVASCGP